MKLKITAKLLRFHSRLVFYNWGSEPLWFVSSSDLHLVFHGLALMSLKNGDGLINLKEWIPNYFVWETKYNILSLLLYHLKFLIPVTNFFRSIFWTF